MDVSENEMGPGTNNFTGDNRDSDNGDLGGTLCSETYMSWVSFSDQYPSVHTKIAAEICGCSCPPSTVQEILTHTHIHNMSLGPWI